MSRTSSAPPTVSPWISASISYLLSPFPLSSPFLKLGRGFFLFLFPFRTTLRKSRAFDWNRRGFATMILGPILVLAYREDRKRLNISEIGFLLWNWVNFFFFGREKFENLLDKILYIEIPIWFWIGFWTIWRFIHYGKDSDKCRNNCIGSEVIWRVEGRIVWENDREINKAKEACTGYYEPIASGYGFPE